MEASVATGYQIDSGLVEASETLELFVCTFAGTDHFLLDTLEAEGIVVESASGVHGPNISEQVLGYVLANVRNLWQAWSQHDRSEWRHYQGGELQCSTATVVGLGPTSQTIIDHFNAFDVDTIGVRYTPSKGGNADEIICFEEDDLLEAFSRTDYLVLACPLTGTTEQLTDEDQTVTCAGRAGCTVRLRGRY